MLIEKASAPLRDASHCLASRNVKEALTELAEPRLREALGRAVAAVAKRVGVKPRVIEAALLNKQINRLLGRIAKTQPQALGVSQHAERLGGFLSDIAPVTMEEGPP